MRDKLISTEKNLSGIPVTPKAIFASARIARGLRNGEILVTEHRANGNEEGPGYTLRYDDAFLVELQLRDRAKFVVWEGGRIRPTVDLTAGEMLLFDLRQDCRIAVGGPYHCLRIHIPRSALDEITGLAGDNQIAELVCGAGIAIADPRVRDLGLGILAELHEGRNSPFVADYMVLALASHVAKHYGRLCGRNVLRGGLAPWQVRRAKELLHSDLSKSPALNEVARACGLSVSHFARAFRNSVGVAPHAWVIRHRIEVAQELLATHGRSLLDIALACGFSDQSHFTRIFSREIGVSPGAWRKSAGAGRPVCLRMAS